MSKSSDKSGDHKDTASGAKEQPKSQHFSLEEPRRGFMYKCLAAGVGAAAGAVPVAAGIYAYGDPLRPPKENREPPKEIRVANLSDVPDDGIPRRFDVIADQWDKWTFTPQQTIGAVYLLRQPGEKDPIAFNVTCPHAGCAVTLRRNAEGQDIFKCPCHNSTFNLDGSLYRPDENPSPRPMDELECEIKPDQDDPSVQAVWVKYKNFYTGTSEKVAKQ